MKLYSPKSGAKLKKKSYGTSFLYNEHDLLLGTKCQTNMDITIKIYLSCFIIMRFFIKRHC